MCLLFYFLEIPVLVLIIIYTLLISGTVGKYTQLTSGCVIGAKCELICNETIPENTVIYGSTCDRRLQAEKPAVSYYNLLL